MNEYDSELMASILTQSGFAIVGEMGEADVILLNTCAVRESAQRKVFGQIHAIHHALADKDYRIGILGCMATGLRDELLHDEALGIDFIVGPDSYKRLPSVIEESLASKRAKLSDISLSESETYADVYPQRVPGVNAWVAVMRGCNNFCTFCVVPYTRGRERSRPVANILDEVNRLVADGYPQVTLLGQNVNSYSAEGIDFAGLLDSVSRVPGIKRIRFTSPHPKDFPPRLLDVIVNNPKVCKHIHLPLQAGNSRVLDLMARSYTKEDYLNLVNAIRQRCPQIVLTTDIIVGFPTETLKEFEDTEDVVSAVQFDSAFIFKYSSRKGTLTSRKFPDDVAEEEKTRRIVRLNEIQAEISLAKNQLHVGEIQPVMIDTHATRKSDEFIQGRNDGNKIVIIPTGNYTLGDIVNVKITSATPHVLRGEVITP